MSTAYVIRRSSMTLAHVHACWLNGKKTTPRLARWTLRKIALYVAAAVPGPSVRVRPIRRLPTHPASPRRLAGNHSFHR
jgi:hypothetical protein